MSTVAPTDPYGPEGRPFRPPYTHRVARRPPQTRGRLAAYLAVRITGLVLAILVLGHFALTHVITDVAEADADFVARRWASALWVAWDLTMLLAAMLHGAAGLWIAIEDYTPDARRRRRRHAVLVATSAALVLIGASTITAAVL